MNAGSLALPEGRAGQMLAVAGALVVLAAVWLGLVAPGLGWYAAREATLRDALARQAHMQAAVNALPALRAAQAAGAADGSQFLVPGDSDAIAGANLQASLTGLAQNAGLTLDSVEMVAATPAGPLREIGVAVSLSATWPGLIAFFTAIETAQPRMVIDDLSVTTSTTQDSGPDVPLQAQFTVSAFRSGGP